MVRTSLCAHCNGSGELVVPDHSKRKWWLSALRKTCDICHGSGVLARFV